MSYMANLNFSRPHEQVAGDAAFLRFGTSSNRAILFEGANHSIFGSANVRLNTSIVFFTGVHNATLGSHIVQPKNRRLEFFSVLSSTYGAHSVKNKRQVISFVSLQNTQQFGTPDLTSTTREVLMYHVPLPEDQVPSITVDYRVKYFTFTGIPSKFVPGSHYVAHYVQFIDFAGKGYKTPALPTHSVIFKNRVVTFSFLVATTYGSHKVVPDRFISLPSIASTLLFGALRVFRNARPVDLHSGSPFTLYGSHAVRNQQRRLYFIGQQSSQLNFHVVYNKNQRVFIGAYMGIDTNPEVFGPYIAIENKNKRLSFFGHQSSRFAYTTSIRNNAVGVNVSGIYSYISGSNVFDHRIRSLFVEPFTGFYASGYTSAHNAARVVYPTGIQPGSVFPVTHYIESLNKFLRFSSLESFTTPTTHFIAYAVRRVQLSETVVPYIPLFDVRINPHPIKPLSFQSSVCSFFYAHIHFNIARLSSANVKQVPSIGNFIVENRNKTLVFPPIISFEVFKPKIENRIKYLLFEGFNSFSVFRPDISYRTKKLTFSGINTFRTSVFHEVRNVLPPLPATQKIFVQFYSLGTKYGFFSIRNNTIKFIGTNYTKYGAHKVARNGVILPSIFDTGSIGVPTFIVTQFVYINSILPNEPEKIRITPHTIYLPSGDQATEQARANHPVSGANKIEPQPLSTNHRVTLRDRSLEMKSSAPFYESGDHTLSLRKQYVYFFSLRSLRVGVIRFLNIPQTVDFNTFNYGIHNESYGQHNVVFPVVYDPTITVTNQLLSLYGEHKIELFNRRCSFASVFGSEYGTLTVGYHRDFVFGGDVLSLFGTTWVSHYTRSVLMQGDILDGFQRLVISGFNNRMRVYRVETATPSIPSIGPITAGIATQTDGFGVTYKPIQC